MSPDKPRSVRQFLMNVPPPSKSVQDDRILEEMNKLHRQNLVQTAAEQAQPKPTTAQIIRRNSLKKPEKRKLTSESGPLSEIDPASDRLAAPVRKFKKPSCRVSTASPVSSSLVATSLSAPSTLAPNSTSSPLGTAPNESATITQILTQGLTKQSCEPKKSPEKSKFTPIDDILDSIFQSAEKTKDDSSKPASPLSNVDHSPKLNPPSESVSISAKAASSHQPAVSAVVSSTVQQSSASASNTVPPTINSCLTALPQSAPPNHLNTANAIHAARPVAPWVAAKQSPVHSQASVAATNQVLHPIGASPLPSPPLSVQQSSNLPVLPPSAAGQRLHSPDNPKKISKNQQKKHRQAAKRAANAAKEHADNRSYHSNNLEDADFDTLLELHEKSASTKPSDQQIDKSTKQNKNKKNKNKKNKASNSQSDLNQNQHIQNQAAKNGKAVYNQTATIHQPDNSQSVSQASHREPDAGSLSVSPTSPHDNSGKPSLEEIARQIIGAPKPLKRPNDTAVNQQNKRQKAKKEFVPLVTCRFFANGYCSNGDACTFKHDKEAVVVQDNPKKKIVCEFFKTGSCCKFDACPFSHDLKLEPCRFFHLNNNCKEASCPYSHEPLNDDMLAKLRKLTGPCRYYHFKGVCNQGDRCPFSHDSVETAELEKVEASIHLCTFYHLDGACAKGDDCFYLHQEATAEQIAELKAKNKKL